MNLDPEYNLLYFVATGLLGAILASSMVRGRGFGFFGNVVVGVLGAFVGAALFEYFGVRASGVFGKLLSAFAGSLLIVVFFGALVKRR